MKALQWFFVFLFVAGFAVTAEATIEDITEVEMRMLEGGSYCQYTIPYCAGASGCFHHPGLNKYVKDYRDPYYECMDYNYCHMASPAYYRCTRTYLGTDSGCPDEGYYVQWHSKGQCILD